MINFLKQIFTWWNKKTIGTFFYTLVTGKKIGSDEFGNKYYSNLKDFSDRNAKRWVIFNGIIEATKIPPQWHAWLHKTIDTPPLKYTHKYKWQKKHEENLTGTPNAYKPEGSLSSNPKKNIKKYEIWKV